MHEHRHHRIVAALCLAATAFAAQAQNAPPIKPGLWQMKMDNEIDGQNAPDVAAHMKNMPPEVRKQMEAMMKQRGVDMGAGGMHRICQNRESLDRGVWKGEQGRCTTELISQSASSWKWRSRCQAPDSQTEGEARFANPESYTVNARTTRQVAGKARSSNTSITAQWLGADCGELKPVRPQSSK